MSRYISLDDSSIVLTLIQYNFECMQHSYHDDKEYKDAN